MQRFAILTYTYCRGVSSSQGAQAHSARRTGMKCVLKRSPKSRLQCVLLTSWNLWSTYARRDWIFGTLRLKRFRRTKTNYAPHYPSAPAILRRAPKGDISEMRVCNRKYCIFENKCVPRVPYAWYKCLGKLLKIWKVQNPTPSLGAVTRENRPETWRRVLRMR